jgi:hypothetical protein
MDIFNSTIYLVDSLPDIEIVKYGFNSVKYGYYLVDWEGVG